MQSLYTAATGMLAQSLNIDTISNNLANVSTNGFKKQRVDFQDLLYLNLKPAGTPTSPETDIPVGIQVGEGVKPVDTKRIFTQGTVQNTDNPLDILIEGDDCFFRVVRPDGQVVYTRDGSFNRDGNGNIVNADGYYLDPPVQIPVDTSQILITEDGRIMVTVAGNTEPTQIEQIELTRFVNPAGLQALGHNNFAVTAASGEPIEGLPSSVGFAAVRQGSLENSNVDVVNEMVSMIIAQRSYEMNARMVTASDQMMQTVANLKQWVREKAALALGSLFF
jgi:flagellar basal-body rod protein FlgG